MQTCSENLSTLLPFPIFVTFVCESWKAVTTQLKVLVVWRHFENFLVCWIRLLWKSLWKGLDDLNNLLLPFQLTIDQCQRTINQDISTRPFNESCEMSMHKCPLHHVTMNFMDWFLNLCRLPRDLYAHLYRLSLSSWFTSSICQTEILKYCREFCANIILSSLILLTLLHLFFPSE